MSWFSQLRTYNGPVTDDPPCSIARSLGVLGERWTLLILRDAVSGVRRFADFRLSLGIAPDVLTERLGTLVEHGVLTREPYREPGQRVRDEYVLTPAGRELQIVLGALQQWGDDHLPRSDGPTVVRRRRDTDRPVHVGYVDDTGHEVALDEVVTVRTAAYPSR
jgi:DNA-binding HxlR family transcriptional regulator